MTRNCFDEPVTTFGITLPSGVIDEFNALIDRCGIFRAAVFARGLAYMMSLDDRGVEAATGGALRWISADPRRDAGQRKRTTVRIPRRLVKDLGNWFSARGYSQKYRWLLVTASLLAMAEDGRRKLWESESLYTYWEQRTGAGFVDAIRRIYGQCGETPPQIDLSLGVPREPNDVDLDIKRMRAEAQAEAREDDDTEGEEWKQPVA